MEQLILFRFVQGFGAGAIQPIALTLAGVGLGLGSGALLAHHAFSAEFDARKPLKLEGTVTKIEWINPHTWFHIDVKKPDGTAENWALEGGTPNVLFRRGFTKESLLPGTEIVIDGYQAKDGSKRANGRNLTLPNGKMLFLGSSGTGAPNELTPENQKK